MGYLKQTTLYSAITIVAIAVGLYFFADKSSKNAPSEALVYPVLKEIAPFSLDNHNQEFTLEDLKGKWSFVFFGYTYCPDVCPTTMAAMRDFYQKLPNDIQADTQIVLVSVDPERDTTLQLNTYVRAFDERFIGVTAQHDTLKPFAESFGAIYFKVGDDPNDYVVDHTAKIFLVDSKARRHAIFQKSLTPSKGFEFNIDQMVADYLVIRNQ